jgi:hypothetical protein
VINEAAPKMQPALSASRFVIVILVMLISIRVESATSTQSPAAQASIVEWSIESRKRYADPFNDVDVDVVFTKNGNSWRVPTFWRGGNKWTVRFAPPMPGRYAYHLESTDQANHDLNGHSGIVTVIPYSGKSDLFRHGAIRVSANKRYFEHADATPFYWLGDVWWTGLSSRLPWDGFKKLTADRKAKGFTVIQIVAGLVPSNEEVAPSDPGFCNEGGCVWTPGFERINPRYFDYADRRIQCLLDNGLVPAIVGAWDRVLVQMGTAKLEKHWRYVVARYGAYPVFWIVGGEIMDPPLALMPKDYTEFMANAHLPTPGNWTAVARYLRATDPYHHPISVHEVSPDQQPLQDESLTDFNLFQPAHFEWNSIAVEVAQLNLHYARTALTKPLVIGEIGFEGARKVHGATFQRVAYWLAMLNGAAGFSYCAESVS